MIELTATQQKRAVLVLRVGTTEHRAPLLDMFVETSGWSRCLRFDWHLMSEPGLDRPDAILWLESSDGMRRLGPARLFSASPTVIRLYAIVEEEIWHE